MYIVPLSTLKPIDGMNQMSSLQAAQQASEAAQPKTGFAAFFDEALQNAREAQSVADNDAVALSLGQTDNLAQVMINAAKASTATQLAVDLTGRAVSAYKEIMQMQV